MRLRGTFNAINYSMDGVPCLSFEVDEDSNTLKKIADLKDTELVIEVKKYHEKRSLNANAYLWQLLDKMAKVLKSDKDTIYLLQLRTYGVFVDLEVVPEALERLKDTFRLIEEFGSYREGMITARCYYGSSTYNRKEMADLIDGTVRDAKDLGIETISDEEIQYLLESWEGYNG